MRTHIQERAAMVADLPGREFLITDRPPNGCDPLNAIKIYIYEKNNIIKQLS
jgi:hypothetical protein